MRIVRAELAACTEFGLGHWGTGHSAAELERSKVEVGAWLVRHFSLVVDLIRSSVVVVVVVVVVLVLLRLF